MPEKTAVTFREAVLGSLLAHACVIIYFLIFPDTFRPGTFTFAAPRDANAPIPLEFLTEPAAPESRELTLGDSGREVRSERRPERAPPPENEEPFSQGNNPNRFVAPPIPHRAQAAPEPGADGSSQATQQEMAGSQLQSSQAPEGDASKSDSALSSGRSEFLVPKRGGSGGTGLREALGKMSLGLSGGAPLKFDNPTGGLAGPTGGLSFDTPGFDWGPYARKIYWIIWTNWTQGWPPAAWAGLQGVVTVRFRIMRDGQVTGITLIDSSGTPAFDTCATVALEASSPLPPLPEEFPKDSEGITARFLYNMEPRAPRAR